MGIENIKEAFPHLIQAYQLAEQANLPVYKMRQQYLKMLKVILNSIERETDSAHTFTEMLLTNVNPSLENSKQEVFSIVTCIDDALIRYPFKSGQREIIFWENKQCDFLVNNNYLLLIHVLFNLIKNAFYYIAASGKPKEETRIEIWLQPGNLHNKLYFKDTGTGIAANILPHIFDRFFSQTYRGAGIGLTFCKMVMESLGGTVTCESLEGSYTQFILAFPCEKGK